MINIFNHLLLVLYFLAFIVAGASIFLGIIYYLFERVIWLKYYIVFIIIFMFTLFIRYFIIYSISTEEILLYSDLLSNAIVFLLTLSISFMIYVMPVFLYHFSSIKMSKMSNLIYMNLSVAYFILSTLGLLENRHYYIFSTLLLYFIIAYLFIVAIRNYKNIEDKIIKLILKALGITTAIIFIIVIARSIYNIYIKDDLSIFNPSYIDITVLLLYIWWNIITLSYFMWYFYNMLKSSYVRNSNINKSENNSIDILTRREKEISNYLLQGKTNKEISLILNISLNTVNNHVANIYDKMNVKNRVEFVSKIIKD